MLEGPQDSVCPLSPRYHSHAVMTPHLNPAQAVQACAKSAWRVFHGGCHALFHAIILLSRNLISHKSATTTNTTATLRVASATEEDSTSSSPSNGMTHVVVCVSVGSISLCLTFSPPVENCHTLDQTFLSSGPHLLQSFSPSPSNGAAKSQHAALLIHTAHKFATPSPAESNLQIETAPCPGHATVIRDTG